MKRFGSNGKSYNYPFGLIKIPGISISFLKTKLKSLNNSKSPDSAAEWFRNRYGDLLANEIALPLIEAWSGAPAEKLASAVVESLPASIFNTWYLKNSEFNFESGSCLWLQS